MVGDAAPPVAVVAGFSLARAKQQPLHQAKQ